MKQEGKVEDRFFDADGNIVSPEKAVRMDRYVYDANGRLLRREWYEPEKKADTQ
jgi:YD repeat-containing protein